MVDPTVCSSASSLQLHCSHLELTGYQNQCAQLTANRRAAACFDFCTALHCVAPVLQRSSCCAPEQTPPGHNASNMPANPTIEGLKKLEQTVLRLEADLAAARRDQSKRLACIGQLRGDLQLRIQCLPPRQQQLPQVRSTQWRSDATTVTC